MLIWVSYSVNNHHVVAVVLQEASIKMGPNLPLKCVMFQYVWWWKPKKCYFKCHTPSWEPCTMAWLFSILWTVQAWIHSFFGNLSWHWREGDVVTSAHFENSLLLYAVQTVEKMADIFIRDTALKRMSLVQKSVWLLVCYINWNICLWFDLHALRMQLDMVTVQRAFLDNVGASEALLQLPEHMKLNTLLCGRVSPMPETKIRGPNIVGDRGAQRLQTAPVSVLLFLVDGPPGRASVVVADIQHNVWVILLSW